MSTLRIFFGAGEVNVGFFAGGLFGLSGLDHTTACSVSAARFLLLDLGAPPLITVVALTVGRRVEGCDSAPLISYYAGPSSR